MKRISARPITEQEAAVVQQALRRAPIVPLPEETIRAIARLTVIRECEYGCRSVEFEAPEGEKHQMADGVGYLKSGDRVDVIVWGRGNHASSLEIVDHEGAGELPEAGSVCSWEEVRRE